MTFSLLAVKNLALNEVSVAIIFAKVDPIKEDKHGISRLFLHLLTFYMVLEMVFYS